MSYLAIARKYRPATFADIVGQEHVVRTLQNAIASRRIHHAYLFCGARGVGKTTAARALAKALNCEQGPTATPCGVCTSCVEITSGSSPDLLEIDGASNNSVDDIRELRDTVGYAPTRGKYKVYLIDEVHMLSKAAFNALLKTLEEPPPHVVFIFATTEPNRILDTILSRVQRFDFKRIPVQAVADRLGTIAAAEGVTLSPSALRTIARAGEGSMRDAQSLLDKVISSASKPGGSAGSDPAEHEALSDGVVAETLGLVDRALLFAFLEGMVKGEPDACLETIAKVYDYGYELSEFTGDLLEVLRNATFVRLSERSRKHVDASPDEIARLEQIVDGVPAEVLTRAFNALLDTHDQVSRASRPRIVLEMAVARLATTRPVEPVSALLARLEDLERKLRPMTGAKTAPRGASARERRVAEPKVGPSPSPSSGSPTAGPPTSEPSNAGPQGSVGPRPPGCGSPSSKSEPRGSEPSTTTTAERRTPSTRAASTPTASTGAASTGTASSGAASTGAPPSAEALPSESEPGSQGRATDAGGRTAPTRSPSGRAEVPATPPTGSTRSPGAPAVGPAQGRPAAGPQRATPASGDRPAGDRSASSARSGAAERARGKEPPLPPWGEEPPPIEADAYTGADDGWSSSDPGGGGGGGASSSRGAGPPRAADLASRWQALGPKLKALGAGATRLAGGKPSLRGDVLVIAVPAGRALAEARRARGEPEVEGVLRSAFPKLRNIEVAPLAGTGTPADHEKALRQQVLDDPELRRIVQKLGAELESVTSLREDDSPQ